MPHVDKRTGELVIRIVYDGPAEAGKTTNINHLTSTIALQRRGFTGTPGTHGRRTEFFDWLDFSGGFIDGRRVRCQLVSVPGQPELLHRRRYLLEAADAIVYVADARPAVLEENIRNLRLTERILQRLGAPVDVGIVVQANKQDLSDAIDPRALASALELRATTHVVPGTAMEGKGVMETFILATRLATDRVRTMLYQEELEDFALYHESPTALYEALEQLERTHQAAIVEAERSIAQASEDPKPPQHQEPTGTEPPQHQDATGTEPKPATEAQQAPALTAQEDADRVRRNTATGELLRSIGPNLELAAGHVWPPVKGRAMLFKADLESLYVPDVVIPWAPPLAMELRTADGWVLHTTERWVYRDESTARVNLLSLVRRQLELIDLLFDARALFLTADDGNFRLWVATKQVDTLRNAFIGALRKRDGRSLGRIWAAATALGHRLDVPAQAKCRAETLCLLGERLSCLALRDDTESPAIDLLTELRRIASAEGARDPNVATWIRDNQFGSSSA